MKEYEVIRGGFCMGASKVPIGTIIKLHPGAARYALAHAYIEELKLTPAPTAPKPAAKKKAAAKKKSTTDVKSDSVFD